MPIALKDTAPPHPHLPIPLGQLSVWQHSTRDHPLLNAGRDEDLPSEADVIIIGSGMCGAVTAHSLLESPNRPNSIVVLEAREICSGASGRNAGHCRPDESRGFTAFSKLHGVEEAKHILKSEREVFNRVNTFVEKTGIECEWTPRDTYDVSLSSDFRDYASKALKDLRDNGGTPEVEEVGQEQTVKETRVGSAHGSVKWWAGTLNPAKLTLGIHQSNVSQGGYKLYAYAPVHGVVQSDDGVSWDVMTPRGVVRAKKVIHATNAYCDALLPELEGLVVPTRAQAVKFSPAPAGPEKFPRIEGSYSLRYQPHYFYSICCRPDNSIVLGLSRSWDGMTPEAVESSKNTVDDSAPFLEATQNGAKELTKLFPEGGWSADPEGIKNGTAEGFEYSWSGIIGMSPDSIPFIGAVPNKPGQYIGAGFNGHGMARIFLCAPALARYVLTGEWDEAMPKSMRITEERLARLRTGLDKGSLSKDGGYPSKMDI
ncbi:hypothetical protein I316_02220 [Kwoniella heveanensis BCC8398]|uniref:FAD dependent oxidoreductase domain-containing protein n=1 Tax=Kwoniella heveanensis BCC8398 TaxID=1296120 RepID=A0A1B9GZB4_9TREE|nr:hypothetical protein I316_02220 [Kwoniella heveanensis BCC8398]